MILLRIDQEAVAYRLVKANYETSMLHFSLPQHHDGLLQGLTAISLKEALRHARYLSTKSQENERFPGPKKVKYLTMTLSKNVETN